MGMNRDLYQCQSSSLQDNPANATLFILNSADNRKPMKAKTLASVSAFLFLQIMATFIPFLTTSLTLSWPVASYCFQSKDGPQILKHWFRNEVLQALGCWIRAASHESPWDCQAQKTHCLRETRPGMRAPKLLGSRDKVSPAQFAFQLDRDFTEEQTTKGQEEPISLLNKRKNLVIRKQGKQTDQGFETLRKVSFQTV